jgi:hypothetical protein
MRRSLVVLATTVFVMVIAPPAFAQARQQTRQARRPVPDAGMFAVGVQVGASLPNEPFFTNGFDLAASAEGYFTPRVSVRGQLSGAWWDIFGHTYSGTVDPVVLDGNLVYNFERGKWHPYVTGGVGMYHYRYTEGSTMSSETKAGFDLGGGAEYFLSRRDAVTGEALAHIVPGDAHGALSIYRPGFWTIAFGYKRYF